MNITTEQRNNASHYSEAKELQTESYISYIEYVKEYLWVGDKIAKIAADIRNHFPKLVVTEFFFFFFLPIFKIFRKPL